MLQHSGDRGPEHCRQLLLFICDAECVRAITPAREVDVAAGALLARVRLGEEAGAEAHRGREVFDGHLRQGGVVGRAQRRARSEVQLEQPRPSFGVDRVELDAQRLERRRERAHKRLETPDLGQAVAQPARKRFVVRIPEPDLVLDRGNGLVAQLGQATQDAAQDLA